MDLAKAAGAAYSLDCQRVVSSLGSNQYLGLSEKEASTRLGELGPNQLPAAPQVKALSLLGAQFKSVLVIVLLLAAGLNLIIWFMERDTGLPYDTAVIMAIVIANAGLGFFQEFRAERSIEKLRALSGPEARVIRGGIPLRLAATQLVPGDIIMLAPGSKVPADGRLCEATMLEVNESPLTGESAPVTKTTAALEASSPLSDRTNMVYAGTTVAAGRGVAIVTATGGATEIGRIARLIWTAPERETPLKLTLNQMARQLAVIIAVVSAIIFLTGLVVSGNISIDNTLNMLLFGVALTVAAIPEGLPAVVTGSLALGTQRMARRQAVIRRLPAVETLGSTTAICSDKTGTLTVGEMTVRELFLPSGRVTVGGAGYEPAGKVDGDPGSLDEAGRLAMTAVLCNDSSIYSDQGGWMALGTPTEASLVTMAVKLGLDYSHLREETTRLAEEPFSPERKRMSVIVSGGGGGAVLHTKGAPEVILPLCTQVLEAGIRIALPDDRRRQFLEEAGRMASLALRPLALAMRVVDSAATGNVAALETDLVLLGLAGISDPPRPEAPAAIKKCHQAGIEVFMVTGDHLATAAAVAAELGIRGGAMTGAEIDAASDTELRAAVDKIRIFARVSPGHKLRIVNALQEQNKVVAVTGDGVNDAPALKGADIGVAMGKGGTDVAREAADMVLLDDNFATIVAAIEEGRTIFTNIRKFLGFLLSANSGLVVTLFLGVLFAGPLGLIEGGQLVLPLLAVQVLWINLVTNGPPALALGVEPGEPDAMLRTPRRRDEPVIDRRLITYIILVGLVSGIGGLVILTGYFPGGLITFRGHTDITYGRTMTFVALTFFQLYDSFNFRDLRASVLGRMGGNRWLVATLVLSAGLMVAVVEWAPLQAAFHTQSLLISDWIVAFLAGSVVLWAVELFKLLSRSRDWATGKIPLR